MRLFRISQPWDGHDRRTGDYLVDLFQQANPSYREFKGIIAFLKEVGVAAIEQSVRVFVARGGDLCFIVGVDHQGTSLQALLVAAAVPTTTFVETIEHIDISQAGGRSPDIFIPLRARNATLAFWRWPHAYRVVQTEAGRNYQDWRARFLVNLPSGAPHIARYRLYFYQEKSEFRFNCGEVRSSAARGDILCIGQAPPGSGYDYSVTLIKPSSPLFSYFSSLCVNAVGGNSTRRWGYV